MTVSNPRKLDEIIARAKNDASTRKNRAFNLFYSVLEQLGMDFREVKSIIEKPETFSIQFMVIESLQYLTPENQRVDADGPCGISIKFIITHGQRKSMTLSIPVTRLAPSSKISVPASIPALIDDHLSDHYSSTDLEPLKLSLSELVEENGVIKVSDADRRNLTGNINGICQFQLATFIEGAIGRMVFWADGL